MKTNVQEFVTFVSLFLSCQQWRAWHAHKRCFLSLLSPFTQPFQPAVDGSLQMFLIFKSHGDSQSLFFLFFRGTFLNHLSPAWLRFLWLNMHLHEFR